MDVSQFIRVYFSTVKSWLFSCHSSEPKVIPFKGTCYIVCILSRSDRIKPKYVVMNSNLMIPDFPYDIRIRLARLIFFCCCVLKLLCLCLVLSNLNSNLLRFHCAHPNVNYSCTFCFPVWFDWHWPLFFKFSRLQKVLMYLQWG